MAMAARAMEYSVPENSTATTNLAALRGTRITEGYSNEYMIKTEAGHKARKSLLSLRERRPPDRAGTGVSQTPRSRFGKT